MPISYDEQIKAPGLEISYDEEMIKHLTRASTDFWYFCQFLKIVHPDEGRITFEPREYQRRAGNLILNNRFTICLFCRQSGKTTLVAAYALWYAIFNDDKYIGIVSNKADSAKDVLERIQMMYEELPDWIKPGVTSYAKFSISFENGTKIKVSATSKSAFRRKDVKFTFVR